MAKDIGENTEQVVNIEIGKVMMQEYQSWNVKTENRDIFEGETDSLLVPDIVVYISTARKNFITPVAIAVKFDSEEHKKEVEERARKLLGKKIRESNAEVEISLAVLVPNYLKKINQRDLNAKIREIPDIKFKFHRNTSNSDKDWRKESLSQILSRIELIFT